MRVMIALLVCGALAAARADEPDKALGIARYEAGTRYYSQREYSKALVEFTAGYELTRRPAFLLNIAQCYRSLGDQAKANEFFRSFIALEPDSPLVPGVRQILGEAPPGSVPSIELTPPTAPPPQAAVGPLVTPASPPAAASAPSTRKRSSAKIWIWTTVGIVVVVGAAVTAIAVSTSAPPSDPRTTLGTINFR